MADTHSILDYASPSEKSSLRLPAKSIITVTLIDDGWEIVETLSGKGGAILAIAFTVICVLILGNEILELRRVPNFMMILGIYAGIVLATIITSIAVINSTWRRTMVRLRSKDLVLTFSSLMNKRRYDWETYRIRGVKVVSGEDAKTHRILHEVQLDVAGDPLVRLFTGHALEQLQDIVGKIEKTCIAQADQNSN